jgi:pimeloyl-ACP methyl ester carboxylesterase
VDSSVARNGDVQIAYEDFGEPGGRPLLLISGLDGQMTGWPDGFCQALAAAGFHVVRYDHRDAGLSTHFAGKKKAYEVADMIEDMMAVLDALGWESANLAGLSMGGGLAQFAALAHPERVRTVTAISAVPQYGQPVRLFRYIRFPGPFKLLFRRYGDSPQDQQRMLTDIIGLTQAKSLPLDDDWVRQVAAESFRRHPPDRHARSRQLAAGFAAKLPAGGISRITQPVLALNGDEDPIVRPSAGRALARAVPHGRFVLVHQMGHMFSAPLWPQLVSEISGHAL